MSELNEEVLDMLNAQVTRERTNQAFYNALAVKADFDAWDGSQKFFKKSALEEGEHAQKIMDYIVARNKQVIIGPLEAIVAVGNNLAEYYLAALAKENDTTDKLVFIYQVASEASDWQTCQFLDWFMEEQTKSVKEFQDIVTELSRTEVSDWPVLDEKYGEL